MYPRQQSPSFAPSIEPRPTPLTIADVVCTRLVRLPPWFTLSQALRVADLRGVEYVLIEEQGRVRGSISREQMRRERAQDTLARWMNRSELFVEPQLSVAEAIKLMNASGISCVPVAKGGMLVGTASLGDLRRLAGNDSAQAA